MYLLFLDHLINGIDVRFEKYGKAVIVKIYIDDLTAPNNCQEEFIQWSLLNQS